MTSVLDLSEDHAGILRGVLRAHLPEGARAFVFGSRAHGGARRYSDLDLAIEWDRPLGLDLLSRIAEALSESDLPYKVDIVDLATTDPAFRLRITADCILFEAAPLAARSVDNQ
jgi:predicted nucleotidyltransferase